MADLISNQQMTIPGIEQERASPGYALINAQITDGRLPSHFPLYVWNQQQERYIDYWAWFNGERLTETQPQTDPNGDPMLTFPLQINFIRTAAFKRAMVVIGEADDANGPLIKTVVSPRLPLGGEGDAPDEDKKLARAATAIIDEVWTQDSGRANQHENAVIGEFLGGSVFKLAWQPWRTDIQVPIVVEKVLPDYFMPIWNPRNYNDLFEVFEVYKINAAQCQAMYGKMPSNGTFALYVEHWKKDTYTITLDGEPLKAIIGGVSIVYKNVKNPWGRPPYVYMPSQRGGGSFFGASFIEDVRGLVKEYNSRMADSGDAVRLTVHRRRYLINSNKEPEEKQMGSGIWYTDLGVDAPLSKHEPKIYLEDPPNFTDSFTGFTDALWKQMLREAGLQNIAFGEDEGSQRSALTLAFRMWPTTAKALMTRTFWTDGLNLLARMMLKILSENPDQTQLRKIPLIPADFERRLVFNQKWPPKLPRDREQETNEVISMYPNLMTQETALRKMGDIPEKDIPTEIEGINKNLEFQAKLQMEIQSAKSGAQGSGSTPATPAKKPSSTTK